MEPQPGFFRNICHIIAKRAGSKRLKGPPRGQEGMIWEPMCISDVTSGAQFLHIFRRKIAQANHIRLRTMQTVTGITRLSSIGEISSTIPAAAAAAAAGPAGSRARSATKAATAPVTDPSTDLPL